MEPVGGTAAVVGAGLMGRGIALVFARRGWRVRLCDVDPAALETARAKIREDVDALAPWAGPEAPGAEAVLERVDFTTVLDAAVAGAEFVLEAVPERLELKQEVFARMAAAAGPDTILASNTSTLSIDRIGAEAGQRGNHVITHWFNPPHLIPVVEVVGGRATAEETVERTAALLESLGKEPVRLKKEVPGFLVNRLQTALFREVVALLQEGVADPGDLDRAVRGSFGLRLAAVGPLETADMGGLDLWCKGARHLYPVLDRSAEPQPLLTALVEQGRTGAKSGRGFFDYGSGCGVSEREADRDRRLASLLAALGKPL